MEKTTFLEIYKEFLRLEDEYILIVLHRNIRNSRNSFNSQQKRLDHLKSQMDAYKPILLPYFN